MLHATKLIFAFIWITYLSVSVELMFLVRPIHALVIPPVTTVDKYKRQDACTTLVEWELKVLGKCETDGPSECTCSAGLYTFRRAFWTCSALLSPLLDDGGMFQEAFEADQSCIANKFDMLCDLEDDNWQCLQSVIGNGWKMPTTFLIPPTVGQAFDLPAWEVSCSNMDALALATDLASVSVAPTDFGYTEWKCLNTNGGDLIVTVLVNFPELQPPMPTSRGACFGRDGCYTMPTKCCEMLTEYANTENRGRMSAGYSAMDQVLDCAQAKGLSNDECKIVRSIFGIDSI
jgi:hypothetical protein